jgi:RHS repeat-associated protein
LGSQLIAQRKNTTLSFVVQDHLGSTTAMADSSGALSGSISYLYFGSTRTVTGTLPTDKKFTGQRLDSDGLYYYGARYYDAAIGRFISPDTTVQNPANPQTLNQYSYCLNNPLKFIDPSGHEVDINGINVDEYYLFEDYVMLGWGPQSLYTLMADPLFQDYQTVASYAPDFTQDLQSATKVVNIVQGSVNGDACGQTLPTNMLDAAGQILFGKSDEVDYTITMIKDITPGLLAHELFHAADPWVSDSIQEEVKAYQFGDKIDDLVSGVSRQHGLSSIDPNNLESLRAAQIFLKNEGQLYDSLNLLPAGNRLNDFHDSISQGLAAIMPSCLYNHLPRDIVHE